MLATFLKSFLLTFVILLNSVQAQVPVVSMVRVYEAYEGQPLEIRLQRSGDTTLPSSVTLTARVEIGFSLVSGTTLASVFPDPGIVEFGPGEVEKVVTVQMPNDQVNQGALYFSFYLSVNTNASLELQRRSSIEYKDDEYTRVTIPQGFGFFREGLATNLTFTREGGLSLEASVVLSISSATGDPVTQLGQPATQTVTFAAGESSKTLVITPPQNTDAGRLHKFNFNIGPVGRTGISNDFTHGFLLDDDLQISIQGGGNVLEGDTASNTSTLVLQLSAPAPEELWIPYEFVSGSAASSRDYQNNPQPWIMVPQGATSASFPFTTLGNTVVEPNKTLTFQYRIESSAHPNIATARTLPMTILNDDVARELRVVSRSVPEGNTGTTDAIVTVEINGPVSTSDITFNWQTSGGSPGTDYVASSGTGTIAAGQSSTTITVPILGDVTVEPNETFTISLSNVVGTSSSANGTVTIQNDDALTFSLTPFFSSDPEVHPEGGEDDRKIFRFNSSSPAPMKLTVNWVLVNGTALLDFDYSYVSTTSSYFAPTIAANSTSTAISINFIGDSVPEPDEVFYLEYTVTDAAGTNYSNGTQRFPITIANDDLPVASLSTATPTVSEGNANQAVTFTVNLSSPATAASTVQWSTAAPTSNAATAGLDYEAGSGTLSFPIGSSSQSFTVNVIGDNILDRSNLSPESFLVNLSTPSGVTLGTSSATVQITDDDVRTLRIQPASSMEGSSGPTPSSIIVDFEGQPLGNAITFGWQVGTSSDFGVRSGTASIPAGQTSIEIPITILGDTIYELTETHSVSLSNIVGASTTSSAGTFTITNDDVMQPSLQSTTVPEGNIALSTTSLTLVLNSPAPANMLLTGGFIDGSALAGVDYVPSILSILIPTGATSVSIPLQRIGDTIVEANKTLSLAFTITAEVNGSTLNATNGERTLDFTLTNDDAAVVSLAQSSVTVDEGNTDSQVTLTANLSTSSTQEITVQWSSLAGGTRPGQSGADFLSETGTIVFPPGSTSQTFAVSVIGDNVMDRNDGLTETFRVGLTSPNGATLGGQPATLFITDDDLRTLDLGNASVTEGNSGTTNTTVTLNLGGAAIGNDVTFTWQTLANTTALAATDFTVATGTGTILAGQTSTTITISIRGETLYELDETFGLQVTGITGARPINKSAIITILNDDVAPIVTIENTAVTEAPDLDCRAWFRVTLNKVIGAPVSFQWATTTGGTAEAEVDYQSTSGTVGFTPGEATDQWFSVPIISDNLKETPETILVQADSLTNATFANAGLATGTIRELAISQFQRSGLNTYILKFPTGRGQSYIIESSSSLGTDQQWEPLSELISGTGFDVTRIQACLEPKCFFRIRVERTPPR